MLLLACFDPELRVKAALSPLYQTVLSQHSACEMEKYKAAALWH